MMKINVQKVLVGLLALGMVWIQLPAQCSFSPTITSVRMDSLFPNSVILCVPDTETLSTQVYDSYQWYSQQWYWQQPNPNPWVAIPGATSQTLGINDTSILYNYKVVCTLDTCTEESPAILVDGYVVGLPFMISTFQQGTFQQTGELSYNVCNGASVHFEDGYSAYGVHTWYRCTPSNIPPVPGDTCIIANVSGLQYTATTSGSYGFYACTVYCPGLCDFLGLPGFITLNFGNWDFCTSNTGLDDPTENTFRVYPNPTSQFLYLGTSQDNIYTGVQIADFAGKIVMTLKDHSYDQPIDISSLPAGNYIVMSRSQSGRSYINKFVKK